MHVYAYGRVFLKAAHQLISMLLIHPAVDADVGQSLVLQIGF